MRAQIRSKGATHLIKVADRAKMIDSAPIIRGLTVLVSATTFKSPTSGAPTAGRPIGDSQLRLWILRARSHRSGQTRLGVDFTSMPSADGGPGTGRGATTKSAVSGPIFSMTPCSPRRGPYEESTTQTDQVFRGSKRASDENIAECCRTDTRLASSSAAFEFRPTTKTRGCFATATDAHPHSERQWRLVVLA